MKSMKAGEQQYFALVTQVAIKMTGIEMALRWRHDTAEITDFMLRQDQVFRAPKKYELYMW